MADYSYRIIDVLIARVLIDIFKTLPDKFIKGQDYERELEELTKED